MLEEDQLVLLLVKAAVPECYGQVPEKWVQHFVMHHTKSEKQESITTPLTPNTLVGGWQHLTGSTGSIFRADTHLSVLSKDKVTLIYVLHVCA